ncbi:cytochrome P450 [Pseudonocardia sp. RS11V-5]|uniref:cytochrome P450 n=1 Tax=Pseudonocardia terrae TaxID=2905831 RepID=UPI001E362FB5|nr:cytochrome P450 [Pseudonocardia terrae]MCE3555437.1 cytochrome P450 [Pseudonocardia terrae]
MVSTYREIVELLHDPRVSSDPRNLTASAAGVPEGVPGLPASFLHLDPPEHDRLRRVVTRHFRPPHTPDRVDGLAPELHKIVGGLIDGFVGRTEVDIVDELAYPLPVAVICQLLGVPREDEPRFHVWVESLLKSLDPDTGAAAEVQQAGTEMAQYFSGLIDAHRRAPGGDMLSALATDDGPEGQLTQEQLLSTSFLLLIAGHETTVNLIANGTLTLLRHPHVLERLRRDPEMVFRVVEELLRYEPPVHFVPWRTALDDIEIADTTMPKGSRIVLLLAAGSRDPDHVRAPDRFDPDRFDPDRFGLAREGDQHLGFGGGIHYCFGAPLARLEAQTALGELARRLVNPRLVTDPPPYRTNPVLRGPRHLQVAFDDIVPSREG